MKKILIMAGGTGGHVFPALAVAQALREKNVEVHWLGTERGMEREWVTRAQIPLHFINISGWRGKSWFKFLILPWRLLQAIRQSSQIIKNINPDAVLGVGGFVSGPGGIAAWLLRKPLIIHEQNSIPGLTNRILKHFAKNVLEGFPKTFSSSAKVVYVGNPIRDSIITIPNPEVRFKNRKGPPRILVLGGSQGARAINQIMPSMMAMLTGEIKPEVWHQTGRADLEETRQMYQILGFKVRLEIFIENMAEAYEWADFVICRAGALTISELIAAGVGSILIPYPHSVDDHQLQNAKYLQKNKAANILLQNELTAPRLAKFVLHFSDREYALTCAMAAKNLFQPNAIDKVVECCMQINSKDETDLTNVKTQA